MGGVTHVALFTWKPGTHDEQVQQLTDALTALPGLIPDIRLLRVGPDAGVSVGNDRYAVVVESTTSTPTGATPPIRTTVT
jgi:hypothetical protein